MRSKHRRVKCADCILRRMCCGKRERRKRRKTVKTTTINVSPPRAMLAGVESNLRRAIKLSPTMRLISSAGPRALRPEEETIRSKRSCTHFLLNKSTKHWSNKLSCTRWNFCVLSRSRGTLIRAYEYSKSCIIGIIPTSSHIKSTD